MDPNIVFLVTAFLGPGVLWLIELYRNFKDRHELTRPPFGMAIFRWRAVCTGDLFFLPLTLLFISMYYARIRAEPSFWTSSGFYLIPFAFGFAVSAGFILFEEIEGRYSGRKKLNLNRVYHFLYFWWMSYMLSGFAIRWIVYRGETTLLIFAACAFFLWAVDIYQDGVKPNPLWIRITRKYPDRSAYL